jgi:hypothetical protein
MTQVGCYDKEGIVNEDGTVSYLPSKKTKWIGNRTAMGEDGDEDYDPNADVPPPPTEEPSQNEAAQVMT